MILLDDPDFSIFWSLKLYGCSNERSNIVTIQTPLILLAMYSNAFAVCYFSLDFLVLSLLSIHFRFPSPSSFIIPQLNQKTIIAY